VIGLGEVGRRRTDRNDIRIFWAVARLGSFTKAAQALDCALTTVTRAVDRLESGLNTRLLERGPNGVSLTAAGEGGFELALTMENSAVDFERLVANTEGRPSGRVKLAARDGFAELILARQLPRFLTDNPDIEVGLDTAQQLDQRLGGEVDLTLTFSPPNNPDLVSVALGHLHFNLFAAPAYLDLHGAPTSLKALAGHAYVHHVTEATCAKTAARYQSAMTALLCTRIETNSCEATIAAVKAGVGLALLPTAALAFEPSLVMLDLPVASRRLWLVRHRDMGKAARIRCVEDWLRGIFALKNQPWYRPEFIHPRDFAAYQVAAKTLPAGMGPAPPRL
jgi:DNA-binding transcriptional LysR family regulator